MAARVFRPEDACCCGRRIMRKVPDTIEAYEPLAASLLSDRHHGVLLTGVCLMLEVRHWPLDSSILSGSRARDSCG